MLLAAHATVGAIVGRAAPDPISAFILAIISHFILDIIPHGDAELYGQYKNGKKVKLAVSYTVIDAIVTAYVVVGISQARLFDSGMNVAAGIIGGLLPDLIVGIYEATKSKILEPFFKFHFFVHNYIVNKKGDIPFRTGLGLQILLVLLLNLRI